MRAFHVALIAFCALATSASGITLGQVDDFQDGAIQGWFSFAALDSVPSGGPAGAGDAYLKVTSTGGTGAAGELRTFSQGTRWGGDYPGAGVTGVSMDLLNLGEVDLEMRILMGNNFGHWTSTVAFLVPPDGQWHHAVFGLTAADLTGIGSLSDVLRYAGTIQIRHQSGPPAVDGYTRIASSVGIDNVRAVPEPISILLCAVGGLLASTRRQPR